MNVVIGPDNIISLIGITLTAIFSWLVWKATKATADATNATLKLNERLVEEDKARKKEQYTKMRNFYTVKIIDQIKLIEIMLIDNMLNEESGSAIFIDMNRSDDVLDNYLKESIDYFKQEEIELVNEALKSYYELRDKYKTRYGVAAKQSLSQESGPVLEQMNAVINKLHN